MTPLNTPTPDEVLDEFMMEYDEPSRTAVLDFINRYPQFQSDIVAFATAWAEEMLMPPPEPLTSAQEERVVSRNDSFVASFFYGRDAATSTAVGGVQAASAPHATLQQLAQRAGVTLSALATQADIDLSVIAKLNNRLIRPETIPGRLVKLAADFLRASEDTVRMAVSGSARLPVGASFLAHSKPQAGEQVAFSVAIEVSQLPPSEKARWLSETI